MTEIEKNQNIYSLLRKIHKKNLSVAKLSSLESSTHKIFSTDKPLKFVKLRSCLLDKSQKENSKNVRQRVGWCLEETDDSRIVTFDVEEIMIEQEEMISSFHKEKPKERRHKKRRKAESHDLNRKKDLTNDNIRMVRKKNYSSKKEKLRKEIAKYFYNSDLMLPGKENRLHSQKKSKNLSKMSFKKNENIILKERNKNLLQKEKFFYKKKLKQKKQ
jgi:hypothetical protein